MTWETRDLPILKAVVELSEEGVYLIRPWDLAERVNMDQTIVERGLAALAAERPPFFEYADSGSLSGSREIDGIHSPTGHARRTIGAWPTAESLAKQIIAGLQAAAEAEPDEEKRSRLKKTADWLGGAGWGIILGVTGNAVSKGIGL